MGAQGLQRWLQVSSALGIEWLSTFPCLPFTLGLRAGAGVASRAFCMPSTARRAVAPVAACSGLASAAARTAAGGPGQPCWLGQVLVVSFCPSFDVIITLSTFRRFFQVLILSSPLECQQKPLA